MITVDERCSRCSERGDIYRMVGYCSNCGTRPILLLYSATHTKSRGKCPVCLNQTVEPDRLATEDEIPEAVSA